MSFDTDPSPHGFSCSLESDCMPGWHCDRQRCVADALMVPGDAGPGPGDGGGVGNLAPTGGDLQVACSLGETCVITLPISDQDTPISELEIVLETTQTLGSVTRGPGALEITYAAPRVGGGADALQYVVYDGPLRSGPWRVAIDLADRTSCRSLQRTASTDLSGAYELDPDGEGGDPAFLAYCDLQRDGGGWTLALKAFGKRDTFAYDAPLWTDDNLLNPTSLSESLHEAKLHPYLTLPFNELLVIFVSDEEDPAQAKGLRLALPFTVPSLQSIFERDVPIRTRAGREAWMESAPGGSLQGSCNREGFNLNPQGVNGVNHASARIGIVANEQDHCLTPNSRIGIGTRGSSCNADDSVTVGTVAACTADDSDGAAPAWAFVYVREAPRVQLHPVSCLQALFDGGAQTGTLTLDPDGPGGNEPFEAWCDQDLSGGGWTLVGKSRGSVFQNVGWQIDNGTPLDQANVYSLDVVSKRLAFAEVAFGSRGLALDWGPNVYRHRALPAGWLNDFQFSTFALGQPITLIGNCEPDPALNMFRYMGHTDRNDVFFFRNSIISGTFGLENQRWDTSIDDCESGGLLNDESGMVMVR